MAQAGGTTVYLLDLFRVGHDRPIKAEPARPPATTAERARTPRARPCPQREDEQAQAPQRRNASACTICPSSRVL